MSDSFDRGSPGPQTLVVRAAFVPEGQEPPPELSSVFDPLKMRATLDPATGTITCADAGIAFDGDVRAEWHPDNDQGGDADSGADAQRDSARRTGGSAAVNETTADDPASSPRPGSLSANHRAHVTDR